MLHDLASFCLSNGGRRSIGRRNHHYLWDLRESVVQIIQGQASMDSEIFIYRQRERSARLPFLLIIIENLICPFIMQINLIVDPCEE